MEKSLAEGFHEIGSHSGRSRMSGGGNFSGFAVQADGQCGGLCGGISLRCESSDQAGEDIAAAGLGQGTVAFAFCNEQAAICGKEVGDVVL